MYTHICVYIYIYIFVYPATGISGFLFNLVWEADDADIEVEVGGRFKAVRGRRHEASASNSNYN